MKVTNGEVIGLIDFISQLESNTDDYDFLAYMFLRNRMKSKKIVSEHGEIIKFLQKEFQKETGFDETKYNEDKEYAKETDVAFAKVVKDSDKLKEFLEEEIDFDFYKVKMKVFEDKKFSSLLVNQILPYMIDAEELTDSD